MKYVLLHSVPGSVLEAPLPREIDAELSAWVDEMTSRGVLLDGSRLRPAADATSVRVPDGKVVVTDGPFAETKEQIAGYDVVDCPDLDSAVAVASAHPTTRLGSIEVRAFEDGMPDPEVPERPADGKLRYLMLVCADMRRAMQAEAAGEPVQPAADSEDEDPFGIDAWVDSVADRRIYGWPLAFPNTAVTVRRVDDRVVTTDGPFAETKEQIAGYDLLECRDLDEALAAAQTHPVAGRGVIELRPLWR